MPDKYESSQSLDVRGTKCPLNFVKTCLALEKMAVGEILAVTIDADSQSAMNIPNSLAQEGHRVVETIASDDGRSQILLVKKCG
jgi:TusA-related sulfurtransferase